jgi:hypothetical protein
MTNDYQQNQGFSDEISLQRYQPSSTISMEQQQKQEDSISFSPIQNIHDDSYPKPTRTLL